MSAIHTLSYIETSENPGVFYAPEKCEHVEGGRCKSSREELMDLTRLQIMLEEDQVARCSKEANKNVQVANAASLCIEIFRQFNDLLGDIRKLNIEATKDNHNCDDLNKKTLDLLKALKEEKASLSTDSEIPQNYCNQLKESCSLVLQVTNNVFLGCLKGIRASIETS